MSTDTGWPDSDDRVESRESSVDSKSEGPPVLTPHADGRGDPAPTRLTPEGESRVPPVYGGESQGRIDSPPASGGESRESTGETNVALTQHSTLTPHASRLTPGRLKTRIQDL